MMLLINETSTGQVPFENQKDLLPPQNQRNLVPPDFSTEDEVIIPIDDVRPRTYSIPDEELPPTLSFSLSFQLGWNLISLPIYPYDTRLPNFFNEVANHIDVVWQYTPSGEWKVWNPEAPDYANTLDEIDPTLGLWMRVKNAFSLEVEGFSFDYTRFPLPEQEGWILTGYPFQQSMSIEDASLLILPYAEINTYVDGAWKVYVPGGSGNNLTSLEPGYGYWVQLHPIPDRSIKINELMIDPFEGELEWIELFNNKTTDVSLEGYTLTNETGYAIGTLSSVTLPTKAYLTVYMGTGTNELDFSDKNGSYYLGLSAEVFNDTTGGVALYQSANTGAANIIDFVSYSETTSEVWSLSLNHSLQADIWSNVNATVGGDGYQPNLPEYVSKIPSLTEGDSIGRDAISTDNNTPGDWFYTGGVHSYKPTPGAQNNASIVFELLEPIALFDCNQTQQGTSTTGVWGYFNGSWSIDPDGNITDWLWDFGDGSSDTGAEVNHTFTPATTGLVNFTVTLTVTDNDGLTNSTSIEISIWANETSPLHQGASLAQGEVIYGWVVGHPPEVTVTWTPEEPTAFQTTTFDISNIIDPDELYNKRGGIVSIAVHWPDGPTQIFTNAQMSMTREFAEVRTYLVGVTAIDDDGQSKTVALTVNVKPLPHKTWTVAVYISGDDNVLDPGVNKDINEMEEFGNSTHCHILVQADRLGPRNTARYYIIKDTNPSAATRRATIVSPRVFDQERNMGDPNELVRFVNWVNKTAPSTYIALIMWGHGGHWQSICPDQTNGNSFINIKELRDAMNSIMGIRNKKVDLLCFDACQMGNIEVAYQLRDYVKWMGGSAENVPLDGMKYDSVLKHFNSTDTAYQLGCQVVQEYANYYDHRDSEVQTYALYNLSRITKLKDAIDELAKDLESGLKDIQRHYIAWYDNVHDLIRWAARESTRYDDLTANKYDRVVVDIWNFQAHIQASRIPKKYKGNIKAVQDELLNVVKAFFKDNDRPGIAFSIYYPCWYSKFNNPFKGARYDSFSDNDFNFPGHTEWDELVKDSYKVVADAGEDKCAFLDQMVVFNARGSSDFDSQYYMDKKLLLHYEWDFGDGASYKEFWKDDDGDHQVDAGEFYQSPAGYPDEAYDGRVKHNYSDPGTYTVNLTVKDGWGFTHSDTAEVVVKNIAASSKSNPNVTWTIMIYAAAEGDNPKTGLSNLDDLIYADLQEFEKFNFSSLLYSNSWGVGHKVKIVAQVDYASKFDGKTMRYEIGYDPGGDDAELGNGTVGWEVEEKNTGGEPCLLDFLSWVHDNDSYQACNYALILWDRSGDYYGGDGWKNNPDDGDRPAGFLRNKNPSDDILEMTELQNTLGLFSDMINRSLELLVFDSSLMGMLEIAHMVRDSVSIMVASEAPEGPTGWNHTLWLESLYNNTGMTEDELADVMVSNSGEGSIDLSTLSAFNVSMVQDVIDKLDVLSLELILALEDHRIEQDLTDNVQIAVRDIRFNTTTYGATDVINEFWDQQERPKNLDAWTSNPRFTDSDNVTGDMDYIDLYDFADKLKGVGVSSVSEACIQLIATLEEAILSSVAKVPYPESHGVSIYFPYQEKRLFIGKTEPPDNDYLYEFNYDDPYHQSEKVYEDAVEFANESLWDELLMRYYEPVADIGFTEVYCYVGDPVPFPGYGSSDADFKGVNVSGLVAEYSWDFGDGASYTEWWDDLSSDKPTYNDGIPQVIVPGSIECSTPPPPDGLFDGYTIHYYVEQGIFTATLTVTDDDGKTDTDTAIVIVLPKPSACEKTPSWIYTPEPERYYTSGSHGEQGPIEYVHATTTFTLGAPEGAEITYRIMLPNGTYYPDWSEYTGSFTLPMESIVEAQDCHGEWHTYYNPFRGDLPYTLYWHAEYDSTVYDDTQYYFVDTDEPELVVTFTENDGGACNHPDTGFSYFLVASSPAVVNISVEDSSYFYNGQKWEFLWTDADDVLGSGLQEANYSVDGVFQGEINETPVEISFDVGHHNVTIHARDNLNITANTTTDFYVITSQTPSDFTLYPANGTEFTKDMSFGLDVEMGDYAWFYQTDWEVYISSGEYWQTFGYDWDAYDSLIPFNVTLPEWLELTIDETFYIRVKLTNLTQQWDDEPIRTIYGNFVYKGPGSLLCKSFKEIKTDNRKFSPFSILPESLLSLNLNTLTIELKKCHSKAMTQVKEVNVT
jgi:PKD repeat protein